MHQYIIKSLLYIALFFSSAVFAVESTALKDAIKEELSATKMEQKTQKKIDRLATKTQDLFDQYRTLLNRAEDIKTYNKQLFELTEKQEQSLATIDEKINNIEKIRQNITPFLLRMLNTLTQFIQLDTPFLLQERTQRITALKALMERPDVNLPEKYRRIMEAYQIELEYGRSIETYKQTIQINDTAQTVNILRIGRLLLLYQTLDKKISGTWSKAEKNWKQLPGEYGRAITDGIKIAAKQAPPELFTLPVPAPNAIQ